MNLTRGILLLTICVEYWHIYCNHLSFFLKVDLHLRNIKALNTIDKLTKSNNPPAPYNN